MLTQQIRRQFLDYFRARGHAIVPSSPVIPHGDPTLLFANAGMNQFKELFLGQGQRDYATAATSQKCIRAGGKHNDLENVGHTARHLTFFEMLGNFSFGDYFKEKAIEYSWDFATNQLALDGDRIWPTIFVDDEEAYALWCRHVPAKRIVRLGEATNFWSMGDVGPCGPCSELLYDRGSSYGDAPSPAEDLQETRYLEFWNLVFMQYNRHPTGTMEPLPRPSIDTGAGLERLVALKMGVDNLFETDLLAAIIAQLAQISGHPYRPGSEQTAPFHVIADHLRSLSFAIADGAQPSNVERGYVLRKLLRRAVRYGRLLGIDRPFLAQLLPTLISSMGDDYRELIDAQERIAELLTAEEEAFLRTWRRGGNLMGQIIQQAKASDAPISGEEAFKLKDTYGLPIDEIILLAKDNSIAIDLARYQRLEEEQRLRSRQSHKGQEQIASKNLFEELAKEGGGSTFTGYEELKSEAQIVAIVRNGEFVTRLDEGQEAQIILSATPFYAEMGGQVGDRGELLAAHGGHFLVENTQAPFKGIIAHQGCLKKGHLELEDGVLAIVDATRRGQIASNHTATHLLHWALQQLLGPHIRQAGSVVDQERLRFDFNHHKALTKEEIQAIEQLVNEKIRSNTAVETYQKSYEEVVDDGSIKQFFGDKYDRIVRVVDIDFSKELCGGTHVQYTGQIGPFRIAKESSIAAGVRRIEAVTAANAEALSRSSDRLLDELSSLVKAPKDKLIERIGKLLEENRQLHHTLKAFRDRQQTLLIDQLLAQREQQGSIPFLRAQVELDPQELRSCADGLIKQAGSLVLLLATRPSQGRCHLMIRISDDLVGRGLHAKQLLDQLAPLIQGSGGGKASMAQAAGDAPDGLEKLLSQFPSCLHATA